MCVCLSVVCVCVCVCVFVRDLLTCACWVLRVELRVLRIASCVELLGGAC